MIDSYKAKAMWLCLCLLGACVVAQAQPPVLKTKLTPTFNMAVVQLHIKAPDGKPYAHQKLMIIEGGARATKTYGTTDAQGVVEFLVRNRRAYRVDFLGAARPKALVVPNKPRHRFRVNLKLDELHPENLFVHINNCDTGKPEANLLIKIQDVKTKKVVYRGKTNSKGIAAFRAQINRFYYVVLKGAAYTIYPSFKVRGSNFSELFTIQDLHFGKEFHYHYQTRCTPPPSGSGRPSSSSGISQILKRNKHWQNSLVVLAGGWFDDHFKMYTQFMKAHHTPQRTKLVVCPHCSICEPYDKKNFRPLIPATNNPRIVLAKQTPSDVLSIFRALKYQPSAKDIVLITANNHISAAEKKLFGKIKVPVKIIVVNVQKIHPYYLDLAKATGGSVHTLKADITQFSKWVIGQIRVINGIKYKLISPTQFKVVK
ncbi:hypothetical protein [Microscilla marina]|uniref:Lipoprotein, putative n=1 Tax=Microscilla marina ATCC 23134 TaxID=313606 RepID=A1ZSY1_MICM2|nr:hypothetical protein [Microscilla marina]EAY26545.1 lipoprotein, putative [Microscilla marina ATCC 23134]